MDSHSGEATRDCIQCSHPGEEHEDRAFPAAVSSVLIRSLGLGGEEQPCGPESTQSQVSQTVWAGSFLWTGSSLSQDVLLSLQSPLQ